jgi:hypothetical protein
VTDGDDRGRSERPGERLSQRAAPVTEGDDPGRGGRPWIERLGLGAIAIVLAGLFTIVAVAAFQGGEPFLGTMGAIGALMTLWVGGLTVLRG